MAKSGENFLTLQAVTGKGYDPLDYRYACLNSHYRKELTFDWDCLDAAKTGLRRLREKVCSLNPNGSPIGSPMGPQLESFESAINDDLNMPQALAITWELVDNPDLSDKDKYATIKKFDTILGLKLDEKKECCIPDNVQALVIKRDEARQEKNWEASDKLRNEIEQAGFMVKDGPGGTEVQPK